MNKSESSPAAAPGFKLYTLQQVSEMTGWSLSHLRRAIRARKLARNKFGRSVRISHADLEAFLSSTRQAKR